MKKGKRLLSWFIPLVLVTVVLMTPGIDQAGSSKDITIWPDELRPTEFNEFSWVDSSGVGPGSFYAPIKFPVGVKLMSLNYYHFGYEGKEAYTRAILFRVKMGNHPEVIADVDANFSNGEIIQVGAAIANTAIVKQGYRYYVVVHCNTTYSMVMGVKVLYWWD
jgi:hypothetical protein